MKTFMEVLKKYAQFTGRASRREFWLFVLQYVIVYIVLAIVLGIVDSLIGTEGAIASIVLLLLVLALIIPSLALSVRRLHDTGRSGWWILISLVPFVGGIVLLVFYVLPSQPGDNAHGANPNGVAAAPATAPVPPPAV